MSVDDQYIAFYQEKLWLLLPGVYRAQDSASLDVPGSLYEMVHRFAVQAALLRRSIDRLWEDQSIESCDDWVIAYIGDLLATNLVASLDSTGQRREVAKTIYYRRRKGTVALIEELTSDLTGWSARVVEFFRHLGRTRHGLDPQLGLPSPLQQAQGLVGPRTQTPAGGWADLRSAYGASLAHGPYDEYCHQADLRRGRQQTGWYNTAHLGVFLWRLQSFGLTRVTPVPVTGCPGHYTFDPTGRELPLFAATQRAFGDQWQTPELWQLPTPLTQFLWLAETARLYAQETPVVLARSLGVFRQPGSFYELLPSPDLRVFPELGRFQVTTPLDPPFFASYHYGFAAALGAGSFDRRPTPPATVTGGGNALALALAGLGPRGTVVIGDSQTYPTVNDLTVEDVTLLAQNRTRPLVRLTTDWVFTGTGASVLALDGLMVSGGDLILRGQFARVTFRYCTLDPGTRGEPIFLASLDQRDLVPCRVWVEGQISVLVLEKVVGGPLRTRHGGDIGQLTVQDSLLQALPTRLESNPWTPADLKDPSRLAARLQAGHDPLSQHLFNQLSPADQANLTDPAVLVNFLNTLSHGPLLYTPALFQDVGLNPETQAFLDQNPTGSDLAHLNQRLLTAAYPLELADAVMALSSGAVVLERVTCLGPAWVHRLEASTCIFHDLVQVENCQEGCVRFSAWTTGSTLPRPYASLELAPQAPLFTSRVFGQPGYGQLAVQTELSTGAPDGSEMGAFSLTQNAIKERSLYRKYQEYLPLGLAPVLIYVT
ncbi:hypothetical protein [Candidatus Cyanaurora vandensis]|uniref:hypothetical protein n=1 Tax=Candidatus Cyanaurora vandensis TaxID=2714958 RepID=UPI00257A1BE4|nr:hypothetical protein [Candidatus Cyanaurora vandensis]